MYHIVCVGHGLVGFILQSTYTWFSVTMYRLGLESQSGINTSLKKVEAIYNIEPPKTRKQLKRFIGMVNYCRDMWPHRSYVLAPLSALTSIKVKWQWTEEHQNAFMQMKTLIAKETLIAYPNFNRSNSST